MTDAGDRIRFLFDWASARDNRRRLTLWLVIALLLHGGAYLLLRVAYPTAAPVRVSDAGIYVLLPGSPESKRLAPYIAASDPALFAPETPHGHALPPASLPAYQPSYNAAVPRPIALPDSPPRILPPLMRDAGPVTVTAGTGPPSSPPQPATKTQIVFAQSLASRTPQDQPELHFTARPGDQLDASEFLISVAPDGRVLHVIKDGRSDVLDDAASQYLMKLRFQRGPDSRIVWGTATFHWGLDVKREELR